MVSNTFTRRLRATCLFRSLLKPRGPRGVDICLTMFGKCSTLPSQIINDMHFAFR
jgi:hypothetical protein